jgi:hypothetical protein
MAQIGEKLADGVSDIAVIIACAVLMGAIIVPCACADQAVLTINGYAVCADEYIFFMQQERAAVFDQVKRKCGFEFSSNFWDKSCDETTPRILLQNKTIARITSEKIQQILFNELGSTSDVNYASFCNELKRFNAERKFAIDHNAVIYGPLHYTPMQYYDHRMSLLRINAKTILGRGLLDVNDPNYTRKVDANYDECIRARVKKAMITINKPALSAINCNDYAKN